MNEIEFELVLSRAPLRLSLVGGGTDFPDFYSRHGGRFISIAINRYIYCTLKSHSNSFSEKLRLNYSETELVNDYSEIRNDIIRESLHRIASESHTFERLYIGTIGDMRSNSGLGSSSAFACALDVGLSHFVGRKALSPSEIANRACMIEIEKLSKPIGIQDQWASAHGGCSDYRIAKNGEVTVNSLNVSDSQMNVLNHCLLLVDTGISRNAETITEKYSKPSGSQEKSLLQILQMANDLGEILERCNPISIPSLLAQYLNDSWELKRKLSTQVSSKQIENLYQYLIGIGCLGGKISGAGGGGYLLMVVEPAKMEQIQSHLRENNILFDCPMVSPSGAEVLISC